MQLTPTNIQLTPTYIQLTPKAAKPPTSPYSRFVNSRGGGLAGAAVTSPEAAKLLRQGKLGEAAALVGIGYGSGEAFGGVTRFATDQLVKKGFTQAPNIKRYFPHTHHEVVVLTVTIPSVPNRKRYFPHTP